MKITNSRKETVMNLAAQLGYSVLQKTNNIILTKDNTTVVKQGFKKAYSFLYQKSKALVNN